MKDIVIKDIDDFKFRNLTDFGVENSSNW
ncbi:uncharacterized protein METZ01_LOCUS263257 [marine metagenome]|uniref:Uncharacterized protein n=1 Tax=marine metagenome TaxID=408172 RepID=A0A382JGX5_9ZZZZ